MLNPLTSSPERTISLLSSSTIFVIDDESIMVDLITQILYAAGSEKSGVHGFTQSTEALEVMRYIQPDLIITDVHMPNLSGDFLAKMLQWPQFQRAPIIFVTGDEQFGEKDFSAWPGVTGIMTKPFDTVELLECITSSLERGRKIGRGIKDGSFLKGPRSNRKVRDLETGLRQLFAEIESAIPPNFVRYNEDSYDTLPGNNSNVTQDP